MPARAARSFAGAAADSRAVGAGAALLRAAGRAGRRLRLRRAGGGLGRGRRGRRARRVACRRDARTPRSSPSTTRAARSAISRGPSAPRFAVAVVAVTGSNGKTTTKELVAAALRPLGAVLRTPGNFNTDVGLPLTILSASGAEAAWVLEMAMRAPGEIAYLTEIARPEIGIITNVAAAHLETLGSIEGVARAKGELFAGLGPDGYGRLAGRRSADRRAGGTGGARAAPHLRGAQRRRAGPRLRPGGRRRRGRPLRRPRDAGRGAAAARRRAQRPQRRRGARGGGGGGRLAGRRGRAASRRSTLAAAPLGACRRRWAHHPRRLLQRQPGLDERGARSRSPRPPAADVDSRSWATCSSSARAPRRRTGSSGGRRASEPAWRAGGRRPVRADRRRSSARRRTDRGARRRRVVARSGRRGAGVLDLGGRLDPGEGVARPPPRARRRGAAGRRLDPRPKGESDLPCCSTFFICWRNTTGCRGPTSSATSRHASGWRR